MLLIVNELTEKLNSLIKIFQRADIIGTAQDVGLTKKH